MVELVPYQEAPEGFGDFKIGRHVIRTVKYADGLVLLTKGEAVLKGMIERQIEIEKCNEMEMNVEKIRR